MNECYIHLIKWEGSDIICPLCKIEQLQRDLRRDNTMYYGFEISKMLMDVMHKQETDETKKGELKK